MDNVGDVEWQVSPGLTPYPEALAAMQQRAEAVRSGEERELVWLIEHPSLFTAGTSADPAELFNPLGFPVFDAGRGGRYTYHGPGQRVVYLILDLERRGKDIRRFVHSLEQYMIGTLSELGVPARRASGRIGIWVDTDLGEAKIGALGIRVKHWVTLHGFSLNVDPDLAHFDGIVPCGIREFGIASLESLGNPSSMANLDTMLKRNFGGFLTDLNGTCEVT